MQNAPSNVDLSSFLSKLQASPETFFEEVLGVTTLEDYQRRLLREIAAKDRIACSACHDVGKSFTLARVALWFASCFPNSKVITTAPTFNQVQNILWAEMRQAHARAKVPLGGKMNLTDWKLGENWFALGFTPKAEVTGGEGQGTQSSFQGFHAEGGVMIIMDEATGIPRNIYTMAEGLMTSANVKWICIANPTSTASEFYRKFKDPFWAKVKLSCFDSPNLIANGFTSKAKLELEVKKVRRMPDKEKLTYLQKYEVTRPHLLTSKWVVEKLCDWGLDHPLAHSKIFGEFPVASDDSLVPLGVVEAAIVRGIERKDQVRYKIKRKSIGIDVARGGTDDTVITALEDNTQVGFKRLHVRDGRPVVGAAIALARELWGDVGADIFVVDETGVGASVVDFLKEVCGDGKTSGVMHATVRGVQFGEGVIKKAAALDRELTLEEKKMKEQFSNVKARMFRLLAEDLKENGLSLLNESVYSEELPTIRFGYNAAGQMVIESKEAYKKRTGRSSPDASDSLALANFGRYDELEVGEFGEDFGGGGDRAVIAPLASRLRNSKKW